MKRTSSLTHLKTIRILCLVATVVYGSWWFVVNRNNPNDYNPGGSRIVVAIIPFLIYALSFRLGAVARHIDKLFYASLYVLTTHNFFAAHKNYGDVEWPVSTYITATAVYACFQSSPALLLFSTYTIALAVFIAWIHGFTYAFYLPGLITITLLMNLILFYRNRALREVALAKGRFEKLFNAAFEGIVVHEGGKILAVNDSFATLVRDHRKNLIGASMLDFVAPDSLEIVQERMTSPSEQPYSINARRRDGSVFPVELSIKTHLYEDREVRLVAVRDMSERHQIEAERKKKLEAQAAVELRDQFISIASHELRTPLTPLKLANEILLSLVTDKNSSFLTSPEVLKILRKSEIQIGRITRLIDDMLDVSRISRGHFELQLEDFDLARTLEHLMAAHADEIAQGKSRVRLKAPPSLTVHWDRMRTEQIIMNLLKNALIYGDSKPVSVGVRLCRENVVLSVRDRGIGIAPDRIASIFERFERAVPSRNYGGLGLGLYIVQKVVEAHRGQVRVRSRLGQGSRFTVLLPRTAKPASVSFHP